MRRLPVPLLVVVAVAVGANLWARRSQVEVDLSAADRFTLTRETREIVDAVDAPLRISVFLNLEGGAARDARFLLDRYRERNRNIEFRIVDPDERPGEARRLGVTEYATVVLEYRGRRIDAPEVDEVEISSAILRLLRGDTRTVCVLTGHGEGSLDDESPEGLSELGRLLRNSAYEPVTLDLLRRRAVPRRCDLVAFLGPRVSLAEEEVEALDRYRERGGRVFLAAWPLVEADPNPLLRPFGLRFIGGLVVDEARSVGPDPFNLIVESFPTAHPVREGVPRLQFPFSSGLVGESRPEEGLTVSPLALTSEGSFVETDPDAEQFVFSPGDFPGPVLVAAAADASRLEPAGERRLGAPRPGIVRSRLFVTANVSWLTNEFLNRLGNRRFLTNALAWLTEEEQVLTAPSRIRPVPPLPWTPERQARVLAVAVVGVPGAVLVVGVAVALGRRRREGGGP